MKALGSLFGRQVLVFNCDEGMDFKSVSRIFVGIVKTGAWGCFDEFNRLKESVLSSVSQQIQDIQLGLKFKDKSVNFLGNVCPLNLNSGIFVTLNPSGKEYGGRQNLPDNLKQLFRPVAMTFPDVELIAEVGLISNNFKEAKVLSRKLIAIFSLSDFFLSRQRHYDWGLRSIKSVLNLAGFLHKLRIMSSENDLILEALNSSILSKLTVPDTVKFKAVLKNIFPSSQNYVCSDEKLKFESILKEVYTDMGLVYTFKQSERVLQLYEACNQRTGISIVGNASTGKSTIISLLFKSCEKLGICCFKVTLNPKCVDRDVLLGSMDADTREWNDGIVTKAARDASEAPTDSRTFIVFDGDVDPEWIESLNSVLDDNRLLTMPNGERIQLGKNVNFIFETDSLIHASPATISRLGVIYLSERTYDIQDLFNSWYLNLDPDIAKVAMEWVDQYVLFGLHWIESLDSNFVPQTVSGMVSNIIIHLRQVTCLDLSSFIHCATNGMSSHLPHHDRLKLGNEILKLAELKKITAIEVAGISINGEGYSDICTKDPVRLQFSLTIEMKIGLTEITPWINNNLPFFLMGRAGDGKSSLLRYAFGRIGKRLIFMPCNAHTKPRHIIDRILQICRLTSTSIGKVLKPDDGEQVYIYLKDVNVAAPDSYGTVEIVQFLHQFLARKGFYLLSEWVAVENVQFVATLSPRIRNEVNIRLGSLFKTYKMQTLGPEGLYILCHSKVKNMFPNHNFWSLTCNIDNLVKTLTSVHIKACQLSAGTVMEFSLKQIIGLLLSLGDYKAGDSDFDLIKMLLNEINAIYSDRLPEEDKAKFAFGIREVLHQNWDFGEGAELFVRKPAGCIEKSEIEVYAKIMQRDLLIHSRDSFNLDLILFPQCLYQLNKISKVLGKEQGSLLIIGRSGLNFTALTRLSCQYLGLRIFVPKIPYTSTSKYFMADLQRLVSTCITEGVSCVYMMHSFEFQNASFYGLVNSLLEYDIESIYTKDELLALTISLKGLYLESNHDGTIQEFLIHRAQKYLHFVLIFDALNASNDSIFRDNPAIYGKCDILRLENWDKDTDGLIFKERMKNSSTEISSETILRKILKIIQSCSTLVSSPKHNQQLLSVYSRIYDFSLAKLKVKKNYLEDGLRKLKEASIYVVKLTSEAQSQKIELANKQDEANAALMKITESMQFVSQQKSEMQILNCSLVDEEASTVERQRLVSEELSHVEPLIKSAKAAVGDIRSESLAEIRSLRAPPAAIRDVLEGVLRYY